MTKEEMIRVMKYAKKFYPTVLKDEQAVMEYTELYLPFFIDTPPQFVAESMKKHIATSRFFPSVSELTDGLKRAEMVLRVRAEEKKRASEPIVLEEPNYRLENDWIFQLGVEAGF